jgi:hypothetical protein
VKTIGTQIHDTEGMRFVFQRSDPKRECTGPPSRYPVMEKAGLSYHKEQGYDSG